MKENSWNWVWIKLVSVNPFGSQEFANALGKYTGKWFIYDERKNRETRKTESQKAKQKKAIFANLANLVI